MYHKVPQVFLIVEFEKTANKCRYGPIMIKSHSQYGVYRGVVLTEGFTVRHKVSSSAYHTLENSYKTCYT